MSVRGFVIHDLAIVVIIVVVFNCLNIIFVAVDRDTGESATDPAAAINEAFITGTQPDRPPPPQ